MTPVQAPVAPWRPAHEARAAHPAPAVPVVTEQEWSALHGEDTSACRIIITIMAGIFIVGLLLYLVICLSALGN